MRDSRAYQNFVSEGKIITGFWFLLIGPYAPCDIPVTIGLLQFDRRDLPNQPIIICQFNSEELLDGDVFIFAVWSVAFINCPMLMASVLEDGHPKCMGN